MTYKLTFRNESGQPIDGTLYLVAADGSDIGEIHVPVAGITVSDADLHDAESFRAVADGYYSFSTPQLYQDNTFILVAKPNLLLYVGIGFGLLYLLSKVLK